MTLIINSMYIQGIFFFFSTYQNILRQLPQERKESHQHHTKGEMSATNTDASFWKLLAYISQVGGSRAVTA